MTFLKRLLGAESDYATQGPADDYWYRERGAPTLSGASVTAESACAIATVFRCVAIISEAVARLPIAVRREWTVEKQSVVGMLLNRRPNETQSAFEFREGMVAAALLRGRGYARVHPGPYGPISYLEQLPSNCVREENLTGTRRIRFQYRAPGSGREEPITQEEMFVLRGPVHAPRGIVAAARESIGMTIASDRFGAAQFARKPQMTGVIEVPGTLKDDNASKRMAASFVAATSGEGNWFLPGVLEAGAKFNATGGLSMVDAQWLESRDFQVLEMCRWFGLSPVLLGHPDSEGGTFEQIMLRFACMVAHPWSARFEQAVDRDLLLEDEQTARLNLDELTRGDTVSRYTAHRIALGGNAFNSPDERRQMEGFAPRGGRWDEIPVQLNTKIGSDPNAEPNNDPGAPNA